VIDMVFEFFRGGADNQLEEIEGLIHQMLLDCRHTFDLAVSAVIGGAEPSTVGSRISKVDIGVNKAERAVRKELLVHVSVHGSDADLPLVLSFMSIVKDAERVGDYSKNIWDLADGGIDFSTAPDLDALTADRDTTSEAIGEAARSFKEHDAAAAHEMIKTLDVFLDHCDDAIGAQLESTGSARDAVARALFYRYLKRISAHLMNVLTSLVMPVHRLDFYDEKKADRVED
jgi:phosphate transport system protein